jgi:hypothetical protein
MPNDFLPFFQQHFQQLEVEIEAYPDDESLWLVPAGINNSAGNLCYHLCGNLLHFIGYGFGNTGYVRNRPLEFSIKGLSRAELVKMAQETIAMLEKVLPGLDLEAKFPTEFFGEGWTVNQALLRLLGHFTYHLGQVNYHRRLLTSG